MRNVHGWCSEAIGTFQKIERKLCSCDILKITGESISKGKRTGTKDATILNNK